MLDGSVAALGAMVVALVAVASCAGAVTGAACVGGGSATDGDVIACGAGAVVDSEATGGVGIVGAVEAVGAGVTGSKLGVDVLAAGSLATWRLRSLRAEAATLLVERDDSREDFDFVAGAVSTSSFTGLLDFADEFAGADDATGALGVFDSLLAWATVVAEVSAALVSATRGAAAATLVALCAGFATAT